MNADPNPDPGFLRPKTGKEYSRKNIFFYQKIEIYLSLGIHKGRPSYRKPSALKREYPALQNMNFITFLKFL
jgi:hypothetical protein